MHLLLTDRLSCPRCGPSFGLVLRVDAAVERCVQEGVLGCSNCRDRFPIDGGFTDLRAPPRGKPGAGRAGKQPDPHDEAEEEAARLVALLGIARGPGTVALLGEASRYASAIAATVDDLLVAAIDADVVHWRESPGVSRMIAGPGMPFFSRTLRGVVLDGRLGASWLAEGVRVVAPMSRIVVANPPPDTADRLEEAGLEVLAQEAETVVAARG